MGELLMAAIVPHPPIMVEAVGGSDIKYVKNTREAMGQLAKDLQRLQPDTLVVITPHGAVFSDAVTMITTNEYQGNLCRFGASGIQLEYTQDQHLAKLLTQACESRQIPFARLTETMAREHGVSSGLDHGVVTPLTFFYELQPKPRLLSINMGLLSREQLYTFGMALQAAIEASGQKVVVIASSDLSHRLTRTAPGGYSPQGAEFDHLLKQLLAEFDVPGILAIPEKLQEEAGECGYRPILMLLGCLDGLAVDSRVLSYEGPFGVGYLVGRFLPAGTAQQGGLWDKLQEQRQARLAARVEAESPVVKLARHSLEHYYATGSLLPAAPEPLSVALPHRAGVFVTFKKDGQLRGCIGTTGPTRPSVEDEIIANAVKAATEDPRFDPIGREELDELDISVDILGIPEPARGLGDLDPKRYGVIVRSGFRSGLLLPDLAGVDTAEEQVEIARGKAGIHAHEPIKLQRFLVTRYY